MAEAQSNHPLRGDLYTPVTPEVMALFKRMRDEHGSWRKVAAISGTRLKVLRNLRTGTRRAISMSVMDRLCTTTGVGGVHEFTWFTADDLVALGIWSPTLHVAGLKRVKGDDVHFRTKDELKKARKQAKRRKRRG